MADFLDQNARRASGVMMLMRYTPPTTQGQYSVQFVFFNKQIKDLWSWREPDWPACSSCELIRGTEVSDQSPILSKMAVIEWGQSVKWFGYEKSDMDQKTIVCKLCRRAIPHWTLTLLISISHQGVRGESMNKSHHSTTANCSKQTPDSNIAGGFARGTPYMKNSRRWKEITTTWATFICKDMATVYTGKKPGFRKMVWAFDPCTRCQVKSTSLKSSCLICTKSVGPKLRGKSKNCCSMLQQRIRGQAKQHILKWV